MVQISLKNSVRILTFIDNCSRGVFTRGIQCQLLIWIYLSNQIDKFVKMVQKIIDKLLNR